MCTMMLGRETELNGGSKHRNWVYASCHTTLLVRGGTNRQPAITLNSNVQP